MLSGGQVAVLIVAVFFAILMAFLAAILIYLASVLRQTSRLVETMSHETLPLLEEAAATIAAANAQLGRVDQVTTNVQNLAANASTVMELTAATLAGPMVRVAAFGHGVRRALSPTRRPDLERRIRAEVRAQRSGRTLRHRGA
jgi:predicted PurR-regulated permease PerM